MGARYRQARGRGERTTILNEFVALTGYQRKHAIRVLAGDDPQERPRAPRNRLYDEAVRQALIVLGMLATGSAASGSKH